jgi:hypothetical protein
MADMAVPGPSKNPVVDSALPTIEPSQEKPSQKKPSQKKLPQKKPSQMEPLQEKPSQTEPSQVKSSQEKPTFLTLPPELRNDIYKLVFHAKNGLFHRKNFAKSPNKPFCFNRMKWLSSDSIAVEINQLKYVCRQLYKETAGVEVKYNTLVFEHNHHGGPTAIDQFIQFTNTCSQVKSKWIRSVLLVTRKGASCDYWHTGCRVKRASAWRQYTLSYLLRWRDKCPTDWFRHNVHEMCIIQKWCIANPQATVHIGIPNWRFPIPIDDPNWWCRQYSSDTGPHEGWKPSFRTFIDDAVSLTYTIRDVGLPFQTKTYYAWPHFNSRRKYTIADHSLKWRRGDQDVEELQAPNLRFMPEDCDGESQCPEILAAVAKCDDLDENDRSKLYDYVMGWLMNGV